MATAARISMAREHLFRAVRITIDEAAYRRMGLIAQETGVPMAEQIGHVASRHAQEYFDGRRDDPAREIEAGE